jgi:phosphoribosylformylglycinamidine cyclo-ligase
VGFAVGVAERDQLITGEHVAPGDVLIGLPSPGLRSNGYSLARRVLLERAGRSLGEPAFDGGRRSLAEELLLPSVIYAPAILALLKQVDVRAVAHVTGGGLAGNLPRVLPKGVDATVDPRTWEEPRIFSEIRHAGDIADEEMRKVFNLGIGMVVVVPADEAFRALDVLRSHGQLATEIGTITKGDGQVHFA